MDPINVTLFVDPASAASWTASRWLTMVTLTRPVALTLRLAPSEAGRPVARLALATAELVGPDAIVAVYETFGRRHFVLGEAEDLAAERTLNELQLPGFLSFAGGDTKWDADLVEMPAQPLVIDGVSHDVPGLDPLPTGADAAELFDAVRG